MALESPVTRQLRVPHTISMTLAVFMLDIELGTQIRLGGVLLYR